MATNKTWWAPVWRGLVVDPEGKHCRRMKNAVWLFLYLVLHARRVTGTLKRKTETIAKDMGASPKAIQRWLKILRDNGYIETESTGRCLLIVIKLWKTTSGYPNVTAQHGQGWPASPDIDENSRHGTMSAKLLDLGRGSENLPGPNDISIKRKSNNEIVYPADCEALAGELVEALNDPEGLAFYRSLSTRFPELLLRRFLRQALAVPPEQIKKSRAALFNHLMQEHARQSF